MGVRTCVYACVCIDVCTYVYIYECMTLCVDVHLVTSQHVLFVGCVYKCVCILKIQQYLKYVL